MAQQIGSESARERKYGRLLELNDNYPKYVLLADDAGLCAKEAAGHRKRGRSTSFHTPNKHEQ